MLFPESRVGVILLRFAGSSKATGWLTLGDLGYAYFENVRDGMTMKKEAMKTSMKRPRLG